MQFSCLCSLPFLVIGLASGYLNAQSTGKPSALTSRSEPGLEVALDWKWWVMPANENPWGMPLPEFLMPKPPGDAASDPIRAAVRPETYEVQKGDAIIKIAKKFDMTAAQLKQFNNLKSDLIHAGQSLLIPTPGQLLTLVPSPPPPAPEAHKRGEKNFARSEVVAAPDVEGGSEKQMELENVRTQVFLDREMFSPGSIDGKSSAVFLKISELYQLSHPDAANPERLKAKVEAAVKEPYIRYILRPDDFKFIKPPHATIAAVRPITPPPGKRKNTQPDKAIMIDELISADFMSYTNAWEFVAERFHCDEGFLQHINQGLKGAPMAGVEFQVPNVIPFEIEKALDTPLQPPADPQKPVTAAVVLVSRLEISCEGKIIAVMPLASARPGLHGRGSWSVLNAIPQPRLATKRELRELPKPRSATLADAVPSREPVSLPPLANEQYIASGPNNPVGIIWINLAKQGSADPLPYGLHGTSIPAKMGSLQGIGGLRLTNWDIARAVRLMPAGTPLQWKAK